MADSKESSIDIEVGTVAVSEGGCFGEDERSRDGPPSIFNLFNQEGFSGEPNNFLNGNA
jgi:hypothetical protein